MWNYQFLGVESSFTKCIYVRINEFKFKIQIEYPEGSRVRRVRLRWTFRSFNCPLALYECSKCEVCWVVRISLD